MTKLLTIDTSSKNASISYSKDGYLIDEKNWSSKNNHSIELSENIIKLTNKNNLNVNDLDYISVAIGPGGFTSIRVGISFAIGLSKFNKIKLLGLPTFEIEFEKVKDKDDTDLIALIPAGFESYCWKSINNISNRNVDGIFAISDFKNVFKKGTFFGEDTNNLAKINSDYKFFPDTKREPKLMVNLSNKLINEKKQEKYYDLVPIYSRLPNITKKKEKKWVMNPRLY